MKLICIKMSLSQIEPQKRTEEKMLKLNISDMNWAELNYSILYTEKYQV